MHKKILKLVLSSTIICTFFYSHCVWAIGVPAVSQVNPTKSINFLPSDLQETFSKDSCRIDVKPTDFSDFEAFLALLDSSNPLQNHTRLGLNNELGDVAYEKVKVTAKSGTGIFSSKSTVVTEYKYGYDEYGQYEKIWENEIYRKVSSNPLGKIVKAIVAIVTIALTAGMATPLVAAIMALENLVFNVLSGMSFKDALISAAISFAASMLGSFLGGADLTSVSQGLTGLDVFFQALSLADSLMVDDQGRGLFEQLFGEWGSLVFDVISVLVALKSGTGNKGPPYQVYAALGRLAVSTILTALGDRIDPRLRQFISAFTTSFLNAWAKAKTDSYNEAQKQQLIETMQIQGFQPTYDKQGNITGWIKGEGNEITYLNLDGSFKYQQIYDDDGNLIAIKEPDRITRLDERGIPVYTLFEDGKILSYDFNGNPEGWLVPGALPKWDKQGQFDGSFIESDLGTTYFDKNGNKEAFILKGYTPQEQNGRIIGQFKDVDKNTYIYRDKNAEFVNRITITESGGILADDGRWTTYIDNTNTNIWTRQNTEHSDIYFYDSTGRSIVEKLSTQLDESGLVKGYLYTDLLTGDITKYNTDGSYEGYYQARKDEQGEIIGYKGTDKDGNYVILDRRQDPLYKIDPKGIIKYYDIDPAKIYLIERPNTVYTIGEGTDIKFVIDQNPETGKYILFDAIDNLLADNPVTLVLTLGKDTVDTLPIELRNDIINQQDLYIKSILPEGAEGIVSAAYYDHNAIFIWTDGNETKFYDTSGKLLVQDYANNIAHPILMLANNNRLQGEPAIVFQAWTGVKGIEVSHDQYGNLTIKDEYARYRLRNGKWEIDRKLSTGEWVRTYSDGASKILNPIEIGGYDRLGNKIPTDEPWYLTVFGKIGSKNKSDVEDRLRFREDFEKGKLNLYYPPKPEISDAPALKSLDTRIFLIDPNRPISGAKLLYSFPFVDTGAVYLEMVLRVMESSGSPSEPTFKDGVQLVQGKDTYDLSSPEINKLGTKLDVGFDMLDRLNAAFNVESVNADIQNYSYKISVFNVNGRNTIMVYKDVGYNLPDTNSLSRYDLHSARPREAPPPILLSPPQAISVLKDAFPDLDINYEY